MNFMKEGRDVRWECIGDTKKLCDIFSLVPYECTIVQLDTRKATSSILNSRDTVAPGSTEHGERQSDERTTDDHRDRTRD